MYKYTEFINTKHLSHLRRNFSKSIRSYVAPVLCFLFSYFVCQYVASHIKYSYTIGMEYIKSYVSLFWHSSSQKRERNTNNQVVMSIGRNVPNDRSVFFSPFLPNVAVV